MYNLFEMEGAMHANKRIPDFPEPTCCGLRRWFRHMFAADLLYHPDEPAETIVCRRQFKIDHLCQLNFDQGSKAGCLAPGCG